MGSVATRGPGLRGPSTLDRGGAETRTVPTYGLKELARRQKRQHEIRETVGAGQAALDKRETVQSSRFVLFHDSHVGNVPRSFPIALLGEWNLRPRHSCEILLCAPGGGY
ncbi:hypothetical protein NDU88_006735 [Pleurodeles waltl]|uniref:Uncharacterized protein n=1 Tax=Pleurodeles waltl TaxID=8319 RepID=A0AAV7SQB4_PLEWA|nr:hypothetical protein NDU88_006735 [Pleurodeles waltl]